MISITRVLPFEQYVASNRLALQHGTFKRRFLTIAKESLQPVEQAEVRTLLQAKLGRAL